MILLLGTTDSLQVITGTAVSSINIHASYVDDNAGTITPGSANILIAAATTTSIVAAPGSGIQRNVKSLTIYNSSATASKITIEVVSGSTVALFIYTLNAGETIQYFDGQGFQVTDASGGLKTSARSGLFLKETVLTSGTSFLTTASTNTIFVRVQGGGGAGGGCTVGSATISGGAGGGAAGGYAEKTFAVTPNTSYVYAIGAAGAAGATGANAGGNGGNSTFAVGATTVTANGGNGGAGCTSAAAVVTLGGAAPAVSTNGDVNGSAEPGNPGFVSAVGIAVSGKGGSSQFGGGGNSLKAQGTGNAAIGLGAGGGGGCTISTTGAVAGGAGTAGVIIVQEFA